VRNLCSRLDNLPLALELAAARTAVFSPEQLLERIGQRLDLFKGGRDADPRQQTLRATIDWSHELLDDREQRVFRALSVFAGGCSFEAAEYAAGADADTLQSLLDKSLLRRRDTNLGARYWMLETIREYATERLNEVGVSVVERRHAEHVALLVSEADPHLRHGPDQQGWIERVALDYDNVRAAMRFALAEAPELALQIVGSIAFFVWLRGGFAEARLWVDQSLEAGSRERPGLRAKALECGSIVAIRLGDIAAAQRYAEASLAAYESAGDAFGRASALRELGKVAMALGETERARERYEELARLAEEVGDPWNGAVALNNLGDLALHDGDWATTIELCGRSRELRLRLDDRWGAALALLNVALAQMGLGRIGDAGRSIRTALQENVEIDSTMGTGNALDTATLLAASAREWTEAAVLLGVSARLADDLGTTWDSYEAEELQRAERETRAALGEASFTAAHQRGYGLSREEAIAYAVEVIDTLAETRDPRGED
jgi:tetratricopeptide (TPR) repeat protein